jgi:hypothetical protein
MTHYSPAATCVLKDGQLASWPRSWCRPPKAVWGFNSELHGVAWLKWDTPMVGKTDNRDVPIKLPELQISRRLSLLPAGCAAAETW